MSGPVRSGAYRRRIRVVIDAPDSVAGGLEDDFHYFEVQVRHDGAHVTAVDATSRRWPWTTCPGAAEPLRALAGMPLSRRCLAVGDWTDPRQNCTHMFDLAGLAAAHAARGGPIGTARQYDVAIPFGAQGGRRTAVQLWRDRELTLTWTLEGMTCVDPPPYADVRWRGGFLRWADENLDPDTAEAAIVLRRACDIGMGRGIDLDAIPQAVDILDTQGRICHTMQPGVVEGAQRNVGTIRDYDGRVDELLADGP